MNLSDSAEKGRKIALAAAVMCAVISAFSLFTLNILMAATGFAAAYYIKRGSLTARNFAVILRIADIPALVLISVVASKFAENFLAAYAAAATVTAVLDIAVLCILIFSGSANAYFKEVYAANAETNN